MNRSSLFVLGLLLSSSTCLGQTTPADSQLQALLSEVRQLRQDLQSEVRQLRQDLQTTSIAAQRAQILIYRLQGQEAAVARASQRLDEARDKLARIEEQRQHVVTAIEQNEALLSNSDTPPAERKQIEDALVQLKARLESLENQEQQPQTREIEAQQQLRTEEVRLGDLRDQLDRLDRALENASRRPGT